MDVQTTQKLPRILSSNEVSTLDKPVTTEKPVKIDEPITTEKPVKIDEPITTEKPVTTEKPIKIDKLVRLKEPVTAAKVSSFSLGNSEVSKRVQEQCQQLCFSIFFNQHSAPVRSLGFTSATSGEGKSYLALVTSVVLANDSNVPVTLVECNWDHPSLHEVFNVPATPGFAEWLRGECDESAIRHQVFPNLNFIPAGDGMRDAMKLLQQVGQASLLDMLGGSNDLLIADLPAVLTSSYGCLAAALLEALAMVIYAGTTPDSLVAEASMRLKEMPVRSIILNQSQSRLPRWLQRLL